MSTVVNTHEAKSRLSELIREVERGGEVIVARNGQPVAKLIAWPPVRPERRRGLWADQAAIVGEIDAPEVVGSDPEVLALFDSAAETPDQP